MGRIINEIDIALPAQEVFDYVTTPARRPCWHLPSWQVLGDADHPLRLGERVVEESVATGRPGKVVWIVSEHEAPRH